MKCMTVPANLTWDEWHRLATRQFWELQQHLSRADNELLRRLFDKGLTVNEAVSFVIENAAETGDK